MKISFTGWLGGVGFKAGTYTAGGGDGLSHPLDSKSVGCDNPSGPALMGCPA